MGIINRLKESGFGFKKSLGQNFIVDEGYLDGFVSELGLTKDDLVIEVGTGAATLTRVLGKHAKQVISYEIDKQLEKTIMSQVFGMDNIQIRFQDALEADLGVLTPYKVVANIPYYITTPLVMKFMRDENCMEICVLVQDEFGRRMVAAPGGKEYGALSVAVKSWGSAKIVKKVPRTLFVPQPNVDSVFVVVKRHPEKFTYDVNELERLLKGLFSNRRKTIANGLMNVCGLSREDAEARLVNVGIDPTKRPEQLTVQQFLKLVAIK
ncbi:MAG: 16S rRNA (adenine(1518)-N(6)/adenine(1519)-N(6))-dimethyltransferase RsmA [Firmicutes bacterium]|nr:16S rRNA (adenine(1518)-N(6)/adenine(1519)-N(6))-dimethyltransferase RsmA [Bacillota bacterium]